MRNSDYLNMRRFGIQRYGKIWTTWTQENADYLHIGKYWRISVFENVNDVDVEKSGLPGQGKMGLLRHGTHRCKCPLPRRILKGTETKLASRSVWMEMKDIKLFFNKDSQI